MSNAQDFLNSGLTPTPVVKAMFNAGAGLDIPTGVYLRGRYGEYVLNGGISMVTGVVGNPNQFKSTFMHFLFLMLLIRTSGPEIQSTGNTYDTELTIQEWHLLEMVRSLAEKYGMDMVEDAIINILNDLGDQPPRWVITDKNQYSGNEWYEKIKEFLENKRKNLAKISVETPWWNRERTAAFTIPMPTATEIDSFSEFETDDVLAMQDKNELGESGANTIYMRQALAKNRFLMEAPRQHVGSANFLFMSAHIGKETMMQNMGPAGQQPVKKMSYLPEGDKIKGTSDKFLFLTHNCYLMANARRMLNDADKTVLYPRNSEDDLKLDTDLNLVQVRNLRSKSGMSGLTQGVVISQTEGVLPALTEFHHIKEMDRYGLEGSNVNYSLALYPDCKLQRTTVRGKIDTDAKLRRALNITSEMCQMSYLPGWLTQLGEETLCTPKQLYDDLKAKGYDWDELLETRGWWTYDNDRRSVPFLSTMDLLRMRRGWYHPYWMPLLPGMTERPTGPVLDGTPKPEREKDAQYKGPLYRFNKAENRWVQEKQ